jgi:hypothetical protein
MTAILCTAIWSTWLARLRRPRNHNAWTGRNLRCAWSSSACGRQRNNPLRSYFFAAGVQFINSVIGAAALSSSKLMRNRPSGATSY